MKNSLTLFIIILLLASCQKPVTDTITPVSPNPPKDSITISSNLVTSFRTLNVTDRIYGIDSFEYNADKMIATFYSWSYDSSQTPMQTDSTVMHFFFHTNESVPYQYTLNFKKDQNNFYSNETHQLFYDQLNRVSKDSLMNPATGNSPEVNTYSYTDTSIIYNEYRKNSSTVNNMALTQTDTIFLVNENIMHDVDYFVYYNPNSSFFYKNNITYSSYANPFYYSTIAHTIGSLLKTKLVGDFLSKKCAVSVIVTDSNGITDNINYLWTIDDKGRVVKGSYDSNNFRYDIRYNQ